MTLRLPHRADTPPSYPDVCGHDRFRGWCGTCQRRLLAQHHEQDRVSEVRRVEWYRDHPGRPHA